LAALIREVAEEVSVYTFSDHLAEVPARRGFALRDALDASQPHSGTYLFGALKQLNEPYDRLIVITDEQTRDDVGEPLGKAYVINVAGYKHGVGYGKWMRIDGWSDAVIDYIREQEDMPAE
jgi:60 kDa SS-A/Ro ribonucleoprotein